MSSVVEYLIAQALAANEGVEWPALSAEAQEEWRAAAAAKIEIGKVDLSLAARPDFSPGEQTIAEMQEAMKYSDGSDGEESGVDSLIDYKNALEERLMEAVDAQYGPNLARFLNAIAAGIAEQADILLDPGDTRRERVSLTLRDYFSQLNAVAEETDGEQVRWEALDDSLGIDLDTTRRRTG
jgi:hypothetical protein